MRVVVDKRDTFVAVSLSNRAWVGYLNYRYRQFYFAFMIAVTGIHLAILFFQIPVLQSLPWWFWKFDAKPAGTIPVILAIIILIGFVFWWVTRPPKHNWIAICLLIMAGGLIQHGFALTEGRGLDGIREKTISTGHSEFFEIAGQQRDTSFVAANYETLLEQDKLGTFAKAKPPGTVLFYLINRDIMCLISVDCENLSAAEIAEKLRSFVVVIWPFFTYLAIFPIFLLARRAFDRGTAFVASGLFILVPSINLINLHLDQVLFATLSAGIVCAAATPGHSGRFLAGVILALSLWMSFSFLMLAPIILCALFLSATPTKESVLWVVPACIYIGLGALAVFVLFYLIWGYAPFERYQSAVVFHAEYKNWSGTLKAVLYFAFLNCLEFALWLGIPIILLAFMWQPKAGRGPSSRNYYYLGAAVLCAIFIVAFFGETKGETARLWIPFVPFLCILAAHSMSRFEGRWIVFGVFVLQASTIYLTKLNQDFW